MEIKFNVSSEVIRKYCMKNDLDFDSVCDEISDYFSSYNDKEFFEEELINKILNY